MAFLTPIAVCLLLLLSLGWFERWRRDRAWQAVAIRIQVNGTRGKSTVTRLVWSALREAGIPTLAKTTGAAPRWLLPDGLERPVRRRGKPNIREQLRALLLARRLGARALVLECMALAPDLQWTSEHAMTRSTIGVITNARTDHTEVMGHSTAEIAACLANTVPRQSVLVVGEAALAAVCQPIAAARGTRMVVVETTPKGPAQTPPAGDTRLTPWARENRAIALAVTRELGLADAVALSGMDRAPADPGEGRQTRLGCAQSGLPALDVRKANDPESFLQAVEVFLASLAHRAPPRGPLVVVYNHRSDRPHRLLNFAARAFTQLPAPHLIITGERPALTSSLALRRQCKHSAPRFVPPGRLAAVLTELAEDACGVVFCGNIHGLELAGLLEG